MAALTSNVSTMLDITKRLDPDGNIGAFGELLHQMNPINQDILWKEGNLPTGERYTVRTSLPTATWRELNEGVAATKSTTAQVTEGVAMLEQWHEVDKDIADLNGNTNAYRLSEARGHIESMAQEFAQTLIYGNVQTNTEEFTGLTPRYNVLAGDTGENIISADDSADTAITSIWLVGWAPEKVYGIYPKGTQAGLVHEDLGLVTVQTSTDLGGGRMRAYQDRWQWKCGLAVKDWRNIVRICNLDVDEQNGVTSAKSLAALMVKALHRRPDMSGGRYVWYMNRTMAQDLDLQRYTVVSGHNRGYTDTFGTAYGANGPGDFEGDEVQSFRGVPIRVVDALLSTETLVS